MGCGRKGELSETDGTSRELGVAPPSGGQLELQVCLHTGAGLSPFGLPVNEDTDLL